MTSFERVLQICGLDREEAVQFFRKSMSANVLVGEGSAAGGARAGVWPPRPEKEAGQRCALIDAPQRP